MGSEMCIRDSLRAVPHDPRNDGDPFVTALVTALAPTAHAEPGGRTEADGTRGGSKGASARDDAVATAAALARGEGRGAQGARPPLATQRAQPQRPATTAALERALGGAALRNDGAKAAAFLQVRSLRPPAQPAAACAPVSAPRCRRVWPRVAACGRCPPLGACG